MVEKEEVQEKVGGEISLENEVKDFTLLDGQNRVRSKPVSKNQIYAERRQSTVFDQILEHIVSRVEVIEQVRVHLREVLQHENLLCCHSKMYAMSGLCYDSSTNDYKLILRFGSLPGKPFEFSSLRKKCWTKVDNDVSSNYFAIWGRNKGEVVNGNQHWPVKKKLKNE
ncbi:hypothetical protein LguiA_001680 [Lonicera macranthoides]